MARWRGMLIGVAMVAAQTGAHAADVIDTTAGSLVIVGGFDTEDGGLRIMLDGKPILSDPGMALASVAGSHPDQGPPRILVLRLGTGGNGCPLMLRVIDLGRDPIVISPTFGTCYDEVDVAFSPEGAVRIDQPNEGGRGFSRWTYKDGVLAGPYGGGRR